MPPSIFLVWRHLDNNKHNEEIIALWVIESKRRYLLLRCKLKT